MDSTIKNLDKIYINLDKCHKDLKLIKSLDKFVLGKITGGAKDDLQVKGQPTQVKSTDGKVPLVFNLEEKLEQYKLDEETAKVINIEIPEDADDKIEIMRNAIVKLKEMVVNLKNKYEKDIKEANDKLKQCEDAAKVVNDINLDNLI